MASEEGVVIRIDAAGTWVKTVRGEFCDGCSSKGACHTMGGGKEMEVAVINPIEAGIGDRVVLKLEASPFLKATFLIYMFPILLLVAGATVGEWISQTFRLDSPWPSMLLGFGLLVAGLGVMKTMAQRLAKRDEYRPRITRVIGRAEG
ncbi:MAG: SoxR reducing system RseC family protein [Hyphomicrobiales bacterium]